MRTLKIFFLSRLLREKLMLVLFVAIAALWWASALVTRASAEYRSHHALTSTLAEQKRWLASRGAIEAAAQQAVKNLDPSKTLDDTRLVGDLIALAREHNVTLSNDAPQTVRTPQFAVHTVQINLQRTDWDSLNAFYYAIADRSPYMGVTQFAIASLPNPNQLNASMQVSSVEIVRP
jgi:hypothetical protein